VVAHLVGAIGNGDLRGAAQIHAMLYVLDLLLVVVLAPFARLPRRVARRWFLFPLWSLGHSREQRAEEARALVHLLEAHRASLPADGGEHGGPRAAEYFGPAGRVLVRVVPPLLALILFGVVAIASILLAASVPVALLWRSRRYLADATAVQLTRNPTALYRALIRLVECGAAVTGGERVAHLFVVGPEVAAAREWLDRVHARARLHARLPPPRIRREVPVPRPERVEAKRGFLGEYEGLMGMHPALRRRLARLVRMGAVPPEAPAG
jgi:Zn-dependent protease with chaperone function